MDIKGTTNDDVLNGTSGADKINVGQGGNDTVTADAGDDLISLNGALTATDAIDGGADDDTVRLNGDYSAGLTLGATTLTNIEILRFTDGHDYNITTNNATVAAGIRFQVLGQELASGDSLTFDGSAETNGRLQIVGGAGNDTLTGGSLNDSFNLARGGTDIVRGGGGADIIHFDGTLTAADSIDGGSARDSVFIHGGGNITFGAATMRNVEKLFIDTNAATKLVSNDTTVGAHETLKVFGSALTSGTFTFDGSRETDGSFNIIAGGGKNVITGGASADIISMGATLTAAEKLDGGDGTDVVMLDGNYGAGLTFIDTTMINVEQLLLAAGNNYKFTVVDATLTSSDLRVDGSALGAANVLTFDGSAETAGGFTIFGGAGNDVLTGGAGTDSFNLSTGGTDTVSGNSGNDTFRFAATFTAADQIDGGSGNQDSIFLDGAYSLTFGAATMVNVEHLLLTAGHNYVFTMNDASVAAGATLTVDGQSLGVGDTLQVDGSAETSGGFRLTGGAGNDVLIGGGGSDTFDLSLGGNDTATANGGATTSFQMAGTLTVGDALTGGTAADTVYLNGDYSAGLTITGAMFIGIDGVSVSGSHDYNLTLTDGAATGTTFTLTNLGVDAAHSVVFDGSAETTTKFVLADGSGNDTLKGGAAQDSFSIGGGNDTVVAAGGNDSISFFDSLTAADTIDGGNGSDTLFVNGDYSAGVTFAATTIASIESFVLTAGHNYNLTMNDGNIAGSASLIVSASNLTAANSLTFDGSQETTGHFNFALGAGDDNVTGGGGSDSFTSGTGNDTLNGSGGDDTFSMVAVLTAADKIDGGADTDLVSLNGDYSAGVTFSATTMVNVEKLNLNGGHDYTLTTNNATIAAGQTLTVRMFSSNTGHAVNFNGSAEANGSFDIQTGAGNDTIVGGSQADSIQGDTGADQLTGGGGADSFVFGATDSLSTAYDTIKDFVSGTDKIVLPNAYTLTGVFTASGTVNSASLATDLDALNAMHVQGATVVTVNGGTLSGHTLMMIDGDGNTSFNAGVDFLIEFANTSGVPVATSDFSYF